MPGAPAGNITIVLSADATNFSAGLTEAQRQLDKLKNASNAAGHGTVSSMQAASASIRLLDNPLGNNIRAIERLISQSKVLSGVMKSAFPLVGAIAIGGMIARLGEQVADFIIKVNGMPAAITKGFNDLSLSQKTATDELALNTDRVQNELDKLNKTPQNNLKTAFDESRLAADRLAGSIVSTNAKIEQLLSANHLTAWAVLMGKSGTAATEGAAKYWQKRSDSDAYDLANAAPGSTAETTARNQMAATQAAHLADLQKDLANRQDMVNQTGSNDDANINSDKGQITVLLNQQRQQQEELRAASVATAKQKADDAQAQLAAGRAADQKRLQAMEEALNSEKLIQNVSVKDTYDYWTSKISAFTKGSEAYNAVVAKQTQAALEGAAKAHELITKYQADPKRDGVSDATELPRLITGGVQDIHRMTSTSTGTDTQGYLDSNNLAIQNAANDAREKEATLTDQAGRSITRYSAALQIAQVHAAEFTTQMTALQANLDNTNRNAQLNPTQENLRAQTAAQEAVNRANTQHTIQQQSDNDAINGRTTSGLVGFQDALQEFIQSTRDMAKTMSQLTTSTLGSLNGQIVRAMTGQSTRGDWSNMGAGMFRNAAGVGLQKAEGSMLGGLFGTTKADGSRTSPLYVRLADGAGNLAGSASSGLASLFHTASNTTSSGTNQAGGIGAAVGSLLGKVVGFLPHFAAGGPISSNMLSVVGENGPELFNPGTSGTIIPNHQLTNLGTSDAGTTHNWNIDARGSTDPAQTMAMVQEGIRQAVPHIIKATQNSSTDKNARKATSSRR
jgi:hypothetical protein